MPASHRTPAIQRHSRRYSVRGADPANVDYEAGMRVGLARAKRVLAHPVAEGREREAAMLLAEGFSAEAIIAGLAAA